jgi:hypothetical protein
MWVSTWSWSPRGTGGHEVFARHCHQRGGKLELAPERSSFAMPMTSRTTGWVELWCRSLLGLCTPQQPPISLEPIFGRLGVPDMKQWSRQSTPRDSPQGLGVLAAPALEQIVRAVAQKQFGLRAQRRPGADSSSLAMELTRAAGLTPLGRTAFYRAAY